MYSYQPEKLKAKKPYAEPVYDELVRRARECLIWRMSPAYYDSMTDMEYAAWHEAWAEIVKESSN